ncbi:MAG TPA: hypothetical protein VMW55_03375, partial [Nitrosopumilaceae archaeon]|nr:hypothetical protein [Nitrosopumilaceae archaeon]
NHKSSFLRIGLPRKKLFGFVHLHLAKNSKKVGSVISHLQSHVLGKKTNQVQRPKEDIVSIPFPCNFYTT